MREIRLDRDSERSLTQQLVDAFAAAIDHGELAPGARLPATRDLAQQVGVNQLTATRAYRRLQQMGLVVSAVGRGTFVRESAPLRDAVGPAWQTYVLPRERESEGGRMVRELGAERLERDVIDLSAAYPPAEIFPLEALTGATSSVLAESPLASFDYGPVEGLPELRAALAARARTSGVDDDPESILITTGARQALTLVARATLRPGDKAACESPTFMGIAQALAATGAEVLPVPIDDGGLSVDSLEQLLERHEIRVLMLQSRLQNPTGRDLAADRRERLIELARLHGFFVVDDCVFADLRFEGTAPPSLRALDADHVIAVDSLSKTLAPGLRIGWVAASGPVFDRIATEKASDDAHTPTLTQQLVARFLHDGHYEPQIALARREHRSRRDAMVAAVRRHLGELAELTAPPGGAPLWLRLGRPLDEAALYREATAAGVSFTPGRVMFVEEPRATYLRLCYSRVERARIDEGMLRLARAVQTLDASARRGTSMPLA